MSEFVHLAEYSVEKKYEGKYGAARALTAALYVIIPLAILTVMLVLIGAGAFIWFVPLCPTVMGIVVPLTYGRRFNTEYRYTVTGGDLIITETHSGKYSRELLHIKAASAELIAPYRDEYKSTADGTGNIIDSVSSMNAEDVFFALVTGEDGKKTAYLFEATSKILSLLSFYNKNTVPAAVRF